MTPKEKAKQLYDKMKFETEFNSQPSTVHGMCKKLALVCVDEVISQWDYIDTYLADLNGELNPNLKYWHEVKTELSLL